MPAFCWLLVFYLVLREVPELSITMAVAARDVFDDRSFDEAQALVRGLLEREPEAWDEVRGRAENPQVESILDSLSRWEEPDLLDFNPRPFQNFWDISSWRRPLTRSAEPV
jgi:hypothetical protein